MLTNNLLDTNYFNKLKLKNKDKRATFSINKI